MKFQLQTLKCQNKGKQLTAMLTGAVQVTVFIVVIDLNKQDKEEEEEERRKF